MKSTSKYIQFEVETRMSPFGMFGGTKSSKDSNSSESSSDEYEVASEDDLMQLGKILGGGI